MKYSHVPIITILLCLIVLMNPTYAVGQRDFNRFGCPQGQVPIEDPQFSGGVQCEWLLEPSFYNPNGATLHCRNVFIFGGEGRYAVDLKLEGSILVIEDVRRTDE